MRVRKEKALIVLADVDEVVLEELVRAATADAAARRCGATLV